MQATDALGLKDRRKLFGHLFPNIVPILIVSGTLSVGGAILSEIVGLTVLAACGNDDTTTAPETDANSDQEQTAPAPL